MTDLEALLADWKAKTDAATPGEWGAFQRIAEGAEFDLDADMETTTSSVECITDLRAEDGVGRVCITIADPIISAPDAEFIAMSRTAMPRLLSAVESVLALHHKVEVEPSETICSGCSTLRGTGDSARYFPYEEWPCATVRAIESALGGGDDAE